MTRNQSILCTVTASVLFGFLPLSVTLAYRTGLTAFDVLFFRFLLAGILFFSIVKFRKETLAINKKQFLILLIMGSVGYAMMNLSLFLSYQYISVGLATTIHFSYPIVVTLLSRCFYKEQIGTKGLAALVLSSCGVCLLSISNFSAFNMTGILLAFLSAIFFAAYALFTVHPILSDLSIWKVLFYVSVFTCLIVLVIETFLGTIPFARLTPLGFSHCLVLATVNTVVSVSLFTIGMKKMGPATACILATLEPITSILVGILFLDESLTAQIAFGCALIISAVVLISMPKQHIKKTNQKQGEI